MSPEPVVLEHQQVRLEPLSMGHLEGLSEFCDDREIWGNMGFAQLDTPERLKKWMGTAIQEFEEGRAIAFAVIEKESGAVCGSSRLYQFVPLELGRTWLGAPYRGTAVNTECKYLLLSYAFERLGCIRVDIKASVHNLRSQRAIERVGAVREGVLRAYSLRQDGSVSDIVMYSFSAPSGRRPRPGSSP